MFGPDYSDFVKTLAKPGDQLIAELTPDSANLLHMAVALIGELAAEVAPHFLPEGTTGDAKFDALELDQREANFTEETGDAGWYSQGLFDAFLLHSPYAATTYAAPVGQDVLDLLEGFGDETHIMLRALVSAGRILDIVKKYAVYAKPLPADAAEACMRELRVVILILEAFHDEPFALGGYIDSNRETPVRLEYARKLNREKLDKRYKDKKFSNAAAQDRADKAEGEI